MQPTHLILILIVVLIIFGPGKLPDVGKALGKTVREFRQAATASFEGGEKEGDKTNKPAEQVSAK